MLFHFYSTLTMTSAPLFVLLGPITCFLVIRWLKARKHNYPDIPAIGPSGPLLSYVGAIMFLFRGQQMIQEGYTKYKGSMFKIPQIFSWNVVVTSPKLIEDIRKARDDELSLDESSRQSFQTDYTVGPEVFNNPYHVPLIRTNLTRNINALLPEIREEVCAAFERFIPPTDEWVSISAYASILKVVSQASNRAIVGLSLCRHPEFIDLNIQFTLDIIQSGMILNSVPSFLRSIVARYFTNVSTDIARAVRLMEPIIKKRYHQLEQHGPDWEGKPNDFLMWLMEKATGQERESDPLARRILGTNFAAIHTTSMSFGFALYELAAHPEYVLLLREEVERVVEKEGWTKVAMQKMRKLDSFLRETQRFYGTGLNVINRTAMKDFRFSDGTLIPKGGYISATTAAIHHDEEFYPNADVFDPWRFANIREEDTESLKHQMVHLSREYLAFGHGKHACPGRFFAANELKGMLAHVVLTYDVRMEEEGVIPRPLNFGFLLGLDNKAKVMFRRRRYFGLTSE